MNSSFFVGHTILVDNDSLSTRTRNLLHVHEAHLSKTFLTGAGLRGRRAAGCVGRVAADAVALGKHRQEEQQHQPHGQAHEGQQDVPAML